MAEINQITESEWEVMKVLWAGSPLTSEEIIARVSEEKDWAEQTIRTFITRLHKKGMVHFKRSGRNYLYYPSVSEKECVKSENKFFLERVYNGALGRLFANFIEESPLSETEIDELEILLKRKREEKI